MKKNVFLVALALIISLGFSSCNDDEKENETARVQLKLVDAPGDYEEVNIEIIDMQYNASDDENGWQSFTPQSGYPIQVDLTELIAGNDLLLTDEIMPSGMLKQVRLVLSGNNTLLIEGEPTAVPLDTPSAEQSGLKLKLDTELEAGFSYTFILDWDVQKSIIKAGNSDKYILKPVIRVNAEVNSGSISGKVIGDLLDDELIEAKPLANVAVHVYTLGEVYVTESLTNANGDFLIQGLGAGDYKIEIEATEYVEYESEPVNVKVGEVTVLETIELLVPVS